MKTTRKKALAKKLNKKATKVSNKRVPLAHQNRLILRRLRLVGLGHTGRVIHRKNTSHASLMIILLVFGLFLFASGQYARAIVGNGSVTIGTIVLGEAPKLGALITLPKAGEEFIDKTEISVSGICEKKTFVVVKDNNSVVGSTNCTEAGTFSLGIQLKFGDNVLSALNYDNLNQVGPETKSVKVAVLSSNKTSETIYVAPELPDNPSNVSGVNVADCNNYNVGQLPTGNEPHVAVVYAPRTTLPNISQIIGVLAWGGEPPYAISVNWNNGTEPTLISMASAGYKVITFNYAVPKTYKINFKLKDHADKEAIVETAVQVYDNNVSGTTSDGSSSNDSAAKVGNNMMGAVADVISSGWLETPVPFYLMAVAITLGFWLGDIFDRHYGSRITTKKKAT